MTATPIKRAKSEFSRRSGQFGLLHIPVLVVLMLISAASRGIPRECHSGRSLRFTPFLLCDEALQLVKSLPQLANGAGAGVGSLR